MAHFSLEAEHLSNMLSNCILSTEYASLDFFAIWIWIENIYVLVILNT